MSQGRIIARITIKPGANFNVVWREVIGLMDSHRVFVKPLDEMHKPYVIPTRFDIVRSLS